VSLTEKIGRNSLLNIISITMAGFMSFIARGLASIPGHLFCYSAISSAAIVGILPGYLIRKSPLVPSLAPKIFRHSSRKVRSSLELGSKNAVCGAINLVCALFMTVSLGFALPMGSDFYLIFDRPARATLRHYRISSVIDLVGIFVADNNNTFGTGIPAAGSILLYQGPNFPDANTSFRVVTDHQRTHGTFALSRIGFSSSSSLSSPSSAPCRTCNHLGART
jgi:hypothetical protein